MADAMFFIRAPTIATRIGTNRMSFANNKMVKSANINTQRGECDYFPDHGTFIGLYPKISGNTCQWSWSDGSPLSYSNWDSSYNNSCDPNDWSTKNSIAYLTTTDGKWNLDDNAEIGYPSICAFD
uniref:C-type lectin domain-containing protein n=1 Tax=Acrobeloides nanus TaxID=290746 RepID=A0A914CG68_9BILA